MSEFENMDTHVEEARRIGEEVARAYDEGVAQTLKAANKNVVKAFNERYKSINYQHEYGLITADEYYKKLEQARDRYFSSDTQEWHKYTEEIFSYRKEALEDYKNYVEKNFEDLAKTIDAKRTSFKDKLLDFSGSDVGFDTRKITIENYWPTGDPLVMYDYTLSDYEKEIEKLKSFNDSINKLKEKAKDVDPEVFSEFFGDMRNMSLDDAQILTELLLKANQEDFNEHFALYDERNKLAENIATSFYADDYNALANEMKQELISAFGELPPEFFEQGQTIAQNFADGFLGELNEVLQDLAIEVPVIEAGATDQSVENNTFSPVYYFFGDRAKTSRTRIIAKGDALYSYMRGEK